MSTRAQLSVLPADDRRHASRRVVNFAAALRRQGATTTTEATIHNVGSGGCKLETNASLSVDDEIWLKFPDMEAKRARVVWVNGTQMGCQFAHPLYAAELDSITPSNQPLKPKGIFKPV